MQTRTLASGPGWRAADYRCSAGPRDRPFEERHEAVSVAAVTRGTFQYRTTSGDAFLAPGAVLLGDIHQCFECSHEHGVGDRCISFHFEPGYWESIVSEVPGARSAALQRPHVPPVPALIPFVARLAAAGECGDAGELEELGLAFAGATAAVLADGRPGGQPSQRDRKRIAQSVRRIESQAGQPLALSVLALDAAMSPYHFLRTFRRVVGMTPYQFVLRTRLHRAAIRLRLSDAPVSDIALDAGFNDLSTFNRRFRRLMGTSPGAYRARIAVGGPDADEYREDQGGSEPHSQGG